MKYLDLFSGIGGFTLGIQQAYEETNNNLGRITKTSDTKNRRDKSLPTRSDGKGRRAYADCIGYSEIDKYAIQIYEKHFNHKNYGDITKIDPSGLPEFDLLCGGFPCQSFSIAGKRGGFEDTRGTLFFNIADIARHKRPHLLLLENVKGFLSHEEGRTFNTIICTLTDLGYDLEWQVLNSKNFGVPQNRERVFIVGYLGGRSGQQIFPIGEATQGTIKVRARGRHQQDIVYDKSGILNLPAGTHGSTPHLTKIIDGGQAYRVYDKKGLSPTIPTPSGGNHIPQIQDTKIRRLTPTECERLQGFPDGWTKGVSDTQRYKCLGNAVTVNVVREIIKRLSQNQLW